MKFIAIKTDDGTIKGKLAFYCRMLHVSRQGFYKYLSVKGLMLSRLVDTFFSRTSWTMLLYAENHSISVA